MRKLIDPSTLDEIKQLYRTLIDSENRHDIAAVGKLVWSSGSLHCTVNGWIAFVGSSVRRLRRRQSHFKCRRGVLAPPPLVSRCALDDRWPHWS
jgi:hypothetical protein